MHHPLFFGVLFGVLLARFVLRRRFGWRSGHCGGHGRGGFGGFGGFGPGFGRRWQGGVPGWGGPLWRRGERWFDEGVDLGAGGGGGAAPAPGAPVDDGRLERALTALELSDRQRQELDEVLTRLGESVGGALSRWRGLDAVLAVVGATSFDRAAADAALGHVSGGLRTELVDGLEHAHNVLTPEQREKLAASAQR